MHGAMQNDFKTFPRVALSVLGASMFFVRFAAAVEPAEVTTPDPPGKLYDVGGHKMHLYQSGSRNRGPAVVLEAGSGAFSVDWYLVQQEVAKFATVCSYDRAGHA